MHDGVSENGTIRTFWLCRRKKMGLLAIKDYNSLAIGWHHKRRSNAIAQNLILVEDFYATTQLHSILGFTMGTSQR